MRLAKVLAFRTERGVFPVESLDAARELAEDEDTVVWVDLEGRSRDGEELLSIFGFHPLAIEDVFKEDHRPKLEDFDDYLYLIVQGLRGRRREEWDLEEPEFTELDLFIGPKFVVTHHHEAMPAIKATRAMIDREPKIMALGPMFVAHAILDRMVDRYLPLIDQYDEEVERLEERVLRDPEQTDLERILWLLQGLGHLRRMAIRQRAILARLADGRVRDMPEDALPFYRDVHEHFAHFVEDVEGALEDLRQVFNAFHSLASHRMNEIMQVLTMLSTIVLPLTLLTGLYGMNFDHMPELHYRYGYYGLLGIMAAITLGLTLWFRRRGWI